MSANEPEVIALCAGGHARVVIEVMRRAGRRVTALLDANSKLHGTVMNGVPIIGTEDVLKDRAPAAVLLINALGNRPVIGNSGLVPRQTLFERLTARGFTFAQVISPDAIIAADAKMDAGCHVLTGAIVHPGSSIGANTIINTGAQLDHNCHIGAHAHVAPGAVLCGNVTVGAFTHIGAGAIVIQDVTIGDNVLVGAGAIVTADVASGITVVGRPAIVARARS